QKIVEFVKVLTDQMAEIALLGTHPPKSITGYKPMFSAGRTIFEKAKELQSFDDTSTGTDTSFGDIANQLAFKIFKKTNPATFAILDLINLFDEQDKNDNPKKNPQGKFVRFAHKETRLQVDTIGKAPTTVFKDVYFRGDG